MAAAVAPPLSSSDLDSSADARKRRREVLASQRRATLIVSSDDEEPACKRKKPQMKYDPEVPMSKEDLATWRREQRKKRNRESAAASRQRQRDRIDELEAELDGWKAKYAEVLSKIQAAESGEPVPRPDSPPLSTEAVKAVSCVSPTTSATFDLVTNVDPEQVVSEEESELLPSKMISRPA